MRFLLPCLLLAAAVSPALGQDMTRRDRLNLLYSTQVVFDRRGEPLVSVRVTESQTSVVLKGPPGLVTLPGGDDGSRLKTPRASTWTITLEDARPGEVRYWVAAERLPANNLDAVMEARDIWQAAGHQVTIFEAGAVIGLAGHTLDTRSFTVAVDPQPTEAAARAHALALAKDRTLLGEVIDESRRRPGGWLVAKERRTGLEVRAKDLLWFIPPSGRAVTLPDMEWGHGTPKRGRADRSYRGEIYVTVGNDGRLAVVNLLSAEALLEGVVPSELYSSAPAAALRVQAVAARGQLLAKVGTRHRSDPYLLCAETHCQVYSGDAKHHPRTTAAVKATRGQLLFDDHGLVDTVYSSACGGHSEAFDVYWGGPEKPALKGVLDLPTPGANQSPVTDVARFIDEPPAGAWCGYAKVFRWTKTRTGAQITKAVKARKDIGPVHTIEALRRGRSGRALAVKYTGRDGELVVEGAYNNRKLIGRLRSGMWVVRREGGAPDGQPKAWHFRGGGFGHGVGMCQHGAMGMARAKKDHPEILKHYYRGSRLERAW